MTDRDHVEIETKYVVADDVVLPSFMGIDGVAAVEQPVEEHLDAEYFDTADHRLLRAGFTLRRRSGGGDAGWHLKLPQRRRRAARGAPASRPLRHPGAQGAQRPGDGAHAWPPLGPGGPVADPAHHSPVARRGRRPLWPRSPTTTCWPSPRARRRRRGGRSRSSSSTPTAVSSTRLGPSSSMPSANGCAPPVRRRRSRRPSWPAPSAPPPSTVTRDRPVPDRQVVGRRGRRRLPRRAGRQDRWSSTPPCVVTIPMPCTRCGWPHGGCAARWRRTAGSSTRPSPNRCATS